MLKRLSLHVRRAERALKPVTLTVCAYEAAAIAHAYTRPDAPYRVPLISEVMHEHKWAIPVFLGVLAVHFWYLPEKVISTDG